ncbi:androgen-dependent TFPI-regulating protein-like [Hetaerina americana]|uniref:androgen-dependent TFPI-regulating protein-like n=1 Tax=Hetaerina americana TaxID=62018 RepID=UPI003A7F1E96
MSAAKLQLTQRVFHVGTLLYYIAVNAYIVAGMEHAYEKLGRPKDDPMVTRMLAGSATYFTVWNLLVQQVYFSLCCLEYLLELFPKALSPTAQEQMRTTRRIMLPTLLFPCSCEVVFNFWALYWVSPRLVFGDFLDVINPMWINHAIHTNILPIAVLEMLLRARSEGVWDGGFLRDANKLNSFFTVYLVTVLVGYYRRGTWPYPFMDPLNGLMFFGLVALCYVMGWIWFSFGRCLNQIFSGGLEAARRQPVDLSMKTR